MAFAAASPLRSRALWLQILRSQLGSIATLALSGRTRHVAKALPRASYACARFGLLDRERPFVPSFFAMQKLADMHETGEVSRSK